MWDQRYRPLRFADVLGQEGAIQVLKARLKAGTALDTSYIFSGGHGQGKTTLARILARAMLCQDLQADAEPCNECDNCKAVLSETTMAFMELDAASRGTIDNIRGIVDDLPFAVQGARKRIYLFDEAHRMGIGAQDVLLKPIEDKQMVAILCTTEPEKIRGPIRSRCEEHSIRKITRDDILARMKWVLDQEGVEHDDDDAVRTIIDYSGGHVRDIINKLEMIAQLGPVTVDTVRENLHLSVVSTFYEILLSLGDPATSVKLTEQACDRVGAENVRSGLAEAAMNAYRLKHGMFAEFVYVDRELASKTHEVFGDGVIRLAEYFLRSPQKTKIALVCDVVRCSGGVPAAQAAATPAAPVVVQAPAPKAAAAPTPAASPEPTQEPTKAAPAPSEAAAAPTPAASPEPPPKPTDVRSDGVGNLGSSDINARTEVDTKGVPEKQPRKRGSDKAKKTAASTVQGQTTNILDPPQWRREFAESWVRNGV